MKSKFIFFFLTFLLTTGCQNTSSKVSLSSSSISTSISSKEESSVNYDDLSFVFSKSLNYALRNPNTSSEYYFEISNEDLYMNVYDAYGYVVLEEDENFLHVFSLKSLSNESYDVMMDVFGRNDISENLEKIKQEKFLSYFYNYIDEFKQKDKFTWTLNSTSLCNDLSNFFQLKSLRYCDNVEIIVNEKGKLDKVNIYEGTSIIVNAILEYRESKDFSMYKKWIDNGRKINDRIIDLKMLYENNGNLISLYERNKIEIEGTVVAIDSDNNIYIANEDEKEGSVGIKVKSNTINNVTLFDRIKVKGIIETKDYKVNIINAEIEKLNETSSYLPIYDEEMVVDSYGGGTYAAQIFSNAPYYNDSLYTTFAYVNNMPLVYDDAKDIIIDVICPTYISNNDTFQMQVIIPSSLDNEKKEYLFNQFQLAKLYNEEGALELCLDKFIIQYDQNYKYKIRLLATSNSDIYKKLNAKDKIEKFNKLIDFPLLDNQKEISYRFGGSTGLFLEDNYGIETKDTQGVFINYVDIDNMDVIYNYFTDLENYGAIKYDEIKDVYSDRHYIYTKQDAVIDIMYSPIDYYSSTASLYIWIYNSELLSCPTINERINNVASDYFNVDNFLKLSGTYDADYRVFELYGYSDNLYTKDDPLICVTLDTKEKIQDDYNKALIQMGYKQVRNTNNKPYSYKSRGQNHSLFEKDGVYLDVACYHTSDYTYYKHEEYEYRLEILIYKNDALMNINKYDSLEPLISLYKNIDERLEYKPNLPDDVEVELWVKLGDYTMWDVNYGYGHSDQAFIYTNEIDLTFDALKEALLNAEYVNSSNSLNSSSFLKTIDGETYYVFILKEKEKGYVRLFHDVGGVDFIR